MKKSLIIFSFLSLLISASAFADIVIKTDDSQPYALILKCETYQETAMLMANSQISFNLPGDGCSVIVKNTQSRVDVENNTTYVVEKGEISEN